MQKKVYFFAFSLVLSVILPFYLSLLVFFGLLQSRRFTLFLWIFAAFLYGISYQLLILPQHLPVVNEFVKLRAEIDKLGSVGRFYQTMVVKTSRLNDRFFHVRLKLTDYQTKKKYKVGELYQFKAKLKPIYRYFNEGSSDKPKLMRARGIIGKGYVKKREKLGEKQASWIDVLRDSISHRLSAQIQSKTLLGLVQSLTVGVRDNIDTETWQLFRDTGTGHLIAISGLHVGLISGFFYYLGFYIWRSSASCCQFIPAQRVAGMMAVCSALIYALLAGFGLPTQRALIMVSVFMMGRICQSQTRVWHNYGLSLLFVLLLNPFAICLPGFYFSFFVVFVILSFANDSGFQWLRLQVIITVLLLPLTLYFFSNSSLVNLPANLIAIPLISFVVLPLSLMLVATVYFSVMISQLLIWVLIFVKTYLFNYLFFLSSLAGLRLQYSMMHAWQVIWVTACLYSLLKCRGVKRFLSFLCVIPLFIFPIRTPLKKGEVAFSVLDVGQGLAIVMKTKQHVLLYDTGIGHGSGFDMGRIVILPYLSYHGITQIDRLIISHDDIDHRGGENSILDALNVRERVDNDGSLNYHNCHHLGSWSWDGVRFRFLALPHVAKNDNNNSCVLLVDNGYQRTLLLGDIEYQAESTLIKRYGKALHANYMLVPHHGSKTSSSPQLIQAVSPSYAVVSAGRWNRYQFPHDVVVDRFQQAGIRLYNTAGCGQVDWQMRMSEQVQAPNCYTHSYFP